jgi:MFS family permease
MAAFTLLAVACLTIMVGCVIVPGLPRIAAELGVENATGLLVTIPSLGVVIFGPFAGLLIQRVGLYKALCIGLFAYGVLGCGGMLLHGYVLVFADRLLLGATTAVVMAAGTGLISALYEGPSRMTMIARQGMSIELGGVIFLFVGGILASIGWRWPFMLYLVSWLFLVLLLAFVPAAPNVAEDEAAKHQQIGVPRPLIAVYIAAALSMLVFFTAIIVLPISLHRIDFTEAQTGYFLSFVSLAAVGAAAVMPKVIDKLREQGTLALSFMCYATCHALFAMASEISLFIGGAVLLGMGFGLSVPLVNYMTIERSHVQVRGRNLAYLSMAIFSGQFLSAAMELIPGNNSAIFGVAAGIATVTGLWIVSPGSHIKAEA